MTDVSITNPVEDGDNDEHEFVPRPSPFHLRWIHGYNPKVGVKNLNQKGVPIIFYAATNCGVLYNWNSKQMSILQGHQNNVTCIASDKSGQWIASADSGPDNIVIIWDSQQGTPCRTIFTPHGQHNISNMALSGDAKHLVTLACGEKVEINWWIWSLGWTVPHASTDMDTSKEEILCVNFNPENSEQIVLMSKRNIWMIVLFLIIIDERERTVNDKRHNTYELNFIETSSSFEVFNYTSFTFVPTRTQLFVSTSSGQVLVYDYKSNGANVEKVAFVKTVRVEKGCINVIKYVDGVVVTGGKEGDIRFYDEQLRLLYWWRGKRMDSIRGLSFNLKPRNYDILNPKCKKYCECCDKVVPKANKDTEEVHQKLLQHLVPSDATTFKKPFVVRDFIAQTHDQGVVFADFVCEKLHTILDYRTSYITAMSVHPEKSLFCIGYTTGNLEIVNYEVHKIVAKLDLRDTYKTVIPPQDDSITSTFEIIKPLICVTCLKYSPSGMHLACGLNTGQLLFLNPVTIQLIYKNPHEESSSAVADISFSCDSSLLAITHASRTIAVYSYDCTKNSWNFISKCKAHNKEVTCSIFLKKSSNDAKYTLLSLGQDRVLAQYEILRDTMEVKSVMKIEQTAVPLVGIEWISSAADHTIPMLLVANNEYKYNIINYTTGKSLATFLGPRYEDPVSKIKLVNKSGRKYYLLFATNKVIGLQKLPLDGNPYKHMGMLCHPKMIIFWDYKSDTDSLFTLGKNDRCVFQWEVNFNSVEITEKQGASNLQPYYCLLEGGGFGWLYQEMRDLFYYIQILCQGTFSPAIRRVGDFIPIESLPDIMRALGFFPTQYQVENMLTHAKYNIYNKEASSMISFEDFVKLYLNHRPAFGDNITKIKNAFRNFADIRQEGMVISAQNFVNILSDYGENFSEEQACYLLSILYGYGAEERSRLDCSGFTFLPKEITLSEFVYNMLGIQDIDIPSENTSLLTSTRSEDT